MSGTWLVQPSCSLGTQGLLGVGEENLSKADNELESDHQVKGKLTAQLTLWFLHDAD